MENQPEQPQAPQQAPEASAMPTSAQAPQSAVPKFPLPQSLPKIPKPTHAHFEKLPIFIVIVLALMTGVIIFLFAKNITKPEPPVQPQITIIVTPTATPTPIRTFSKISTTAAFMAFKEELNSFSTSLGSFQTDDPTLSPPSLVLPLGFPKQ